MKNKDLKIMTNLSYREIEELVRVLKKTYDLEVNEDWQFKLLGRLENLISEGEKWF